MSKNLNRRQVLRSMAGAGATLMLGNALHASESPAPQRTRMGIVQYALATHARAKWAGRHAGLAPALAFLEESRLLGAGGIQIPLDPKDTTPQVAAEVRRKAETCGMHVEAIIEPPAADGDLEFFEQKIKLAQAAGATLARTVIMPGRRYEQFKTMEEFKEAAAQGEKMLERAEPVLARHRFRLAVENHKTQLTEEQLAMLKRLDSEHIGVCLDFSNNFALLEDPLDTVRALAPYALTVHIKDHQLADGPQGFMIFDTALGEGFLDLPALVAVVRQARPEAKFNLESITRDAIHIPVLTQGYYTTMPAARAAALARIMAIVEEKGTRGPLPEVSKLSMEEQLKMEHGHIARSITYAREKLGI